MGSRKRWYGRLDSPGFEISPLDPSKFGVRGIESYTTYPAERVDGGAVLIGIFLQPGVPSKQDEMAMRMTPCRAYEVPAVEVLRLGEAYVETGSCVAIKDGEFVSDTLHERIALSRGYERHPLDGRRFLVPERGMSRKLVSGPALLVAVPGHNYFHWLLEAVARWLFARDVVGADTRLLVQAHFGPMQTAVFDALGVRRDMIAVMPRDTLLPIDDLYVAQRGVLSGGPRIVPAAVRALRAAMTHGGKPSDRIFVSRGGADRRRISNEAQVLDVVRRHRFTVVEPGDLSVRAQALRFERAEVILGMHGAGLANCAYSAPGATLIELQPAGLGGVPLSLYWYLAAAAGQRYAQIVCQHASGQDDVPAGQRDITVDVQHLDATLSQILN